MSRNAATHLFSLIDLSIDSAALRLKLLLDSYLL